MNRIAIVFPGIGYHSDKPLLYYGRKLAVEAGYSQCINVKYTFSGGKIRGNDKKMKETFESLYAQAVDFLEEIDWNEYDDILFISKSIGTAIAVNYARNKGLQNVRQILYTPLKATFANEVCKPAIAFIGTADPWSTVVKVVNSAKEMDIPIHVYENANHSLETEDTIMNLKILKDVMKKTKKFIG